MLLESIGHLVSCQLRVYCLTNGQPQTPTVIICTLETRNYSAIISPPHHLTISLSHYSTETPPLTTITIIGLGPGDPGLVT